MSFVVSGTDTNIGKTIFCAGLCNFLGLPYWKPVQAGLDTPTDSETVAEFGDVETLPERYRLKLPASPHQSAAEESITLDANTLTPPDRTVVIEGAGGLMVPLTDDTLYIDVFARWKLPLILCARTRLGTINHTLLSLEAARARNIPVHGVAFIGDANDESERIICTKGRVKRLGRLPVIDPLTPARLQAVFAKCFDKQDFA
jgi:dethiobiotin synthetase